MFWKTTWTNDKNEKKIEWFFKEQNNFYHDFNEKTKIIKCDDDDDDDFYIY